MASRLGVPFTVLALFLGIADLPEQSLGPDEAVKPDGSVRQQPAHAAVQQSHAQWP